MAVYDGTAPGTETRVSGPGPLEMLALRCRRCGSPFAKSDVAWATRPWCPFCGSRTVERKEQRARAG